MTQAAALATIEAIVDRGGDADDVLRAVVAALHEQAGYPWTGILFVEDGGLVLGPEAGEAGAAARTAVPVSWQGERVAEHDHPDGVAFGSAALRASASATLTCRSVVP